MSSVPIEMIPNDREPVLQQVYTQPAYLFVDRVSLLVGDPPRPVLQKVSLELQRGDFCILLGANGSGKSSLLRLLAGSNQATRGRLVLSGTDVTTQSVQQRARVVATLNQELDRVTVADFTVAENCRLAKLRAGQRITTDLSDFHPQLPSRLHTSASKLSGGERQALALAMVLMAPPQLLLLDEHTSALDPQAGVRLMTKTNDLIQRHNVTTVMATHNLDDALRYGNRIVIMKGGQVVFSASGAAKRALTKETLLSYY